MHLWINILNGKQTKNLFSVWIGYECDHGTDCRFLNDTIHKEIANWIFEHHTQYYFLFSCSNFSESYKL